MKNILLIFALLGALGASGQIYINSYAFGAAPSAGLLLDDYPNATNAYSFRLLRTSYTGNCIEVRRSSDGTRSNIGFSSGVLDTATLKTFCGAGNCWVTTWYDQSINGRNAVQINPSSQPLIVSSGVVIRNEGAVAVQGNGSMTLVTASHAMGTAFSFFSVFTSSTLSGFRMVYSYNYFGSTVGTQGRFFLNRMGTTVADWVAADAAMLGDGSNLGQAPRFVTNGNVFVANTRYLGGGVLGAGVSQFFVNNSLLTARSSLTGAIPSDNGVTALLSAGGQFDFFIGFCSEIIVYDTDQSSNQAGIRSNINSFYNIY